MAISIGLTTMSTADLVHRYSFDTDARDSIGGADGILVDGASISGGAVKLDGIDDYVSLDAKSIGMNAFSSVTLEAWWLHNDLTKWQRVFDFGDDTSDYLFYSPVGEPDNMHHQTAGLKNGAVEQLTTNSGKLPAGRYHMAMTFDDATDTVTLYVDGVEVAKNTSVTNTLASIGATKAYLGKAQWEKDPYLGGSIEEFRIYDTALSGAEVALSFTQGPDVAHDVVPKPTSVTLLGLGGITLILHPKK
ncbi:LamG domain-containing protein [Verrucomicrobiaceae bacterium N1E253]|uniref:LamG domain-containing protein n=2 Tax=Oceaniferula marina TaxID=2748318 RepID=A0A851GDY0_9BACT|nr:LamG domain-containing protein [Oceaniferula marina]